MKCAYCKKRSTAQDAGNWFVSCLSSSSMRGMHSQYVYGCTKEHCEMALKDARGRRTRTGPCIRVKQ